MQRAILRVDLVSPEAKELLRAEALRLYGKPNASLLVRQLIADHLQKPSATNAIRIDLTDPTVRHELRVPRSVSEELTRRAEMHFSKPNYYINSVLFDHVGHPQLQGDEIETLRRSNFELAKIGSNLNQVAKAFNILVQMGGGGKLPEIGKKMASLRKEITDHTRKVLRVLETKTVAWESVGRGQRQRKKRK